MLQGQSFEKSCTLALSYHGFTYSILPGSLVNIEGHWSATETSDGIVVKSVVTNGSSPVVMFAVADVTFKVANGSWNDGKTGDITIQLFGPEGTDLKLTKDQIPAVGVLKK